MFKQPRLRRPGAVTIYAAVTMVALLSTLALTIDGGVLFAERRHAQSTADAAALAAACDLYDWYWTNSGADAGGTAKTSALTTAAANGYTNDGTTSKVTVNIPPVSGYYAGRRGYAEVLVEFEQTRSFSNLFTSGAIPVRARAVAIGSPVAADVGILVLDPTARSAFNAQGSGTTNVNGTPVVVNSSDPQGSVAGGGGTVKADKFVLTGGYTTSGGGTFNGPIYTNRPPMDDPLAYLPTPDPSTMPKYNVKQVSSGTLNLSPGVYKGGISVSGTGSLNLAPGVYYMDGGGFSFSGQGSLVGHGVMIYNAPGNGNSGGISVTGQGSIDISAPTSGVYQGVTFFQDRTANTTGNIAGSGGATNITGTFYFAGALLNVSGNGGVSNLGSQYISRLLALGGNGGININWQPDQVARKRSIFLVE
jgi:Flp pilus assembly protein TadG